MMRRHRLLAIAWLTFLMGTAGCTVAPRTLSPPLGTAQASNDVLAGRKLFAQHCAACHGRDGDGTTRAPSIQTPSVQEMDDAALVQFLTDGDLRKGMPSWSQLSSARRWQLVRFIRQQQPRAGEAGVSYQVPAIAQRFANTRTNR